MTVQPGSPEWFNYTGNPQDYPVYHDYHYRQAVTDPAILRHMNVSPAYGGGESGMSAQLEAKAKFLSSPTAQWESQRAYERAYRDYISSGGIASKVTPAGVIPQSTMQERKAEAAMIERQQATKEALRLDAMRAGAVLPFREAATKAGEIYAPRFGRMIPQREDPTMKLVRMGGERVEQTMTQFNNMLKPHFAETSAINRFLKGIDVELPGERYLSQQVSKRTPKSLKEFSVGFAKGIEEKPATAAVNFATMFTLAKGTGLVISKVPFLVKGVTAGKVGSKLSIANVGGASLGGMYAVDVVGRVASAPSPAGKLGELTSTEFIPMAAGGFIGLRPLPKPSVSLKFYEINKPVSVPGMGVFYKKSVKVKVLFDEVKTIKSIPTKEELTPKKPEVPEPERYTGETKFDITQAKLKENVIPSAKQFYDLHKKQIGTAMMVEKATGKPYDFVRGVELMKALQKSKLATIKKVEPIPKETRGGAVGLWETKYEASLKKTPVKLMGAEERSMIIAGIKKAGSLYKAPASKNIAMAASILGVSIISGRAMQPREQQAIRTKQAVAIKTKTFVQQATKIAQTIKTRQITDLTPVAFTTAVAKQVAAQKAITKEAERAKPREVIRTKERYPEQRKIFPQLKPKSFLSKVNQHKKKRGKAKFEWNIKNPVPDLESLGF